MKTTNLTLLLTFFSFTAAFSQKNSEKPSTKKNTISIEFYQPIQNSLREFYNDEWILNPSNDYSRNAFSNAFGISYERIKNDVVFRARLGITIRDVKEHTYYSDMNLDFGIKSTINQDYTYSQNHINAFVGIAKRIHIANRFDIDFGIDLAAIKYLEGNGHLNYKLIQKNISDNSFSYSQMITVDDKIGTIQSVGLGPIFKPQYKIFENMVVSMELQIFFMNTFSNDKSTRKEISDIAFPEGNFYENTELNNEINYDVNQWSWTKVSPLIRIGYEF